MNLNVLYLLNNSNVSLPFQDVFGHARTPSAITDRRQSESQSKNKTISSANESFAKYLNLLNYLMLFLVKYLSNTNVILRCRNTSNYEKNLFVILV